MDGQPTQVPPNLQKQNKGWRMKTVAPIRPASRPNPGFRHGIYWLEIGSPGKRSCKNVSDVHTVMIPLVHSQQDLQVFTQVHWRKRSFQHFSNSVKHSVQVDTDAQGPEMSWRWGLEASLVSPSVKNPLAVLETRVWSLDWEDPLEKEMETHSSILAWEILWKEEPGRL